MQEILVRVDISCVSKNEFQGRTCSKNPFKKVIMQILSMMIFFLPSVPTKIKECCFKIVHNYNKLYRLQFVVN